MLNATATAWFVSMPIRSMSSNGPIRKPPTRRITRSIVAGSAIRSSASFSDSSE